MSSTDPQHNPAHSSDDGKARYQASVRLSVAPMMDGADSLY